VSFSYTLFLALVLLFPGFCAFAVVRQGQRSALLSLGPETPNSTSTLFIVIAGAFGGHLLGALTFVLQDLWRRSGGPCAIVTFDPNVYRVLLAGPRATGSVTDLALVSWMAQLAAFGGFGGALGLLARLEPFRSRRNAVDFGWLGVPLRDVEQGRAVILAYVVTKTSYEGASMGYEGIVRRLALGADQTIVMLVLVQVDRFLVKIGPRGVMRIDVDPPAIARMQFHLDEISNVAIEVISTP
jgi:hypothetical protein